MPSGAASVSLQQKAFLHTGGSKPRSPHGSRRRFSTHTFTFGTSGRHRMPLPSVLRHCLSVLCRCLPVPVLVVPPLPFTTFRVPPLPFSAHGRRSVISHSLLLPRGFTALRSLTMLTSADISAATGGRPRRQLTASSGMTAGLRRTNGRWSSFFPVRDGTRETMQPCPLYRAPHLFGGGAVGHSAAFPGER